MSLMGFEPRTSRLGTTLQILTLKSFKSHSKFQFSSVVIELEKKLFQLVHISFPQWDYFLHFAPTKLLLFCCSYSRQIFPISRVGGEFSPILMRVHRSFAPHLTVAMRDRKTAAAAAQVVPMVRPSVCPLLQNENRMFSRAASVHRTSHNFEILEQQDRCSTF